MEIFKLFGTILVDNSKANESLDKSESKVKKLTSTLGTGIKTAGAMGTAIVGAATALTEATKETRNDLARLEANATTAGIQLGTTGKAMQELSKFSEELDSNVEAVSNLIAAGLDDEQMLTALDSLSGAAIKFSDTLKIEGIADGFQETLATGLGTGPFAELIERCGYNLDEFNAGLQDAKTRGEEVEYVLEFLESTGLAGVKKSFEELNPDLVTANQNAYNMQVQLAELGKEVQPLMNIIMTFAINVLQKFNSLDDGTKRLTLTIGAIVVAMGPVITTLGGIAKAAPLAGAAVAALSSPFGMAMAAATALIAVCTALALNWEKIEDAATRLGERVLQEFQQLRNGIENMAHAFYNAGANMLSSVWEGMQSQWNRLSGWVNDKINWLSNKLQFWRNGQAEMSADYESDSGRYYDGSHANGLAYVPYNGYIAQLHEGERVLTKEENREYNSSKNNIQMFFEVAANIREEADIEKLARLLFEMIRNESRSRGVVMS